MITLYTWTTPNGRKISIALEEMELAYEVKPINIGKDEQFSPDFLRISPNNKMPAIVDHAPADGGAPLSVFESGAIVLHIADSGTSWIVLANGSTRSSPICSTATANRAMPTRPPKRHFACASWVGRLQR